MYPDLPNEIGTGSVQLFVALYKGLPVELDDTYLPSPARDILYRANSLLTEEQKAYIESHLEVLPEPAGEGAVTTPTTTPVKTTDADHVEALVKGATTFQQVLDAGITKAQIETILGAAMPPGNATIKDYCLEKGISFSQVKDQLNALVE